MPDKAALAHALQDARQSLESNIEQAVHAYEAQIDGPLDLRIDLRRSQGPPENASDAERELHGAIRSLVEQFQQTPAVKQARLRVRSVTALDSDADGTAAVNVNYAYRDER